MLCVGGGGVALWVSRYSFVAGGWLEGGAHSGDSSNTRLPDQGLRPTAGVHAGGNAGVTARADAMQQGNGSDDGHISFGDGCVCVCVCVCVCARLDDSSAL